MTQTNQVNGALKTNEADSRFDEEVKRYAKWIAADSKRYRNAGYREKTRAYNETSLRTIQVGGQEVSLFAPFRPEFSALQTFTRGQVCTISMVVLVGLLGLLYFHIGMIVTAIAVVTVLYLTDLILNAILSVWTLNHSKEEHIDDAIVHALSGADWPRYTILCPLYREVEVVPQFVEAMLALDYPTEKLQVLMLTEEDDVSTRKSIEAQHLPPHFALVTVPAGRPRTKPRACNYGLLQATGDYVVIYDAEDIPDPLQLKKAVLTFANQGPETACVQAKLNFYNTGQNMLTRWFTAEYSLWFDLTLPGLQRLGVPLPLGGTSNHFRAHALRLMGAWDAFNVTEDCDLGLRMTNYGFKTTMLHSTTYEEANSQLKNWIRQRSRWIKGYMQTYLVYMRKPQVYLHPGRLKEFFSLQLFVGGKTFVLLINPLMWMLVLVYILLHPIDLYHTLFPAPILYMSAACLIFGNFFFAYTHMIGCMRRDHFHLVKWALSIPIYWAMASAAAFLALQQLFLKPHYWEKTQHGLHLHASGSSQQGTIVTEEPGSMADTLKLQEPAQILQNHLPSMPRSEEDVQVVIDSSPNIPLMTGEFEFEVKEQTLQGVDGREAIESFLEEFGLESIEKTLREEIVVLKVRPKAKRPHDQLQTGRLGLQEVETSQSSEEECQKRLTGTQRTVGVASPAAEAAEPPKAGPFAETEVAEELES